MDFYFQGLAWLNKGRTPDHVAQARSFFDRALTADPENIGARFPNLVNQKAHQRDRRWASSSLHCSRPAKNAGKQARPHLNSV
jgi:hypothetical protein